MQYIDDLLHSHAEKSASDKLIGLSINYMHAHACKKGIVITTDSLLYQIQMSEHNSLPCGGELHDNLFLILSQLSSTFHTILAINFVHALNWFTHLQQSSK